jgi:hypothetical protein
VTRRAAAPPRSANGTGDYLNRKKFATQSSLSCLRVSLPIYCCSVVDPLACACVFLFPVALCRSACLRARCLVSFCSVVDALVLGPQIPGASILGLVFLSLVRPRSGAGDLGQALVDGGVLEAARSGLGAGCLGLYVWEVVRFSWIYRAGVDDPECTNLRLPERLVLICLPNQTLHLM